ncbi:hypothetical protein ACIQTZ_19825 [Paenarthrobacter sp. NPDC090520]|uniref:hypothetical protein n=1 Tax=Paenarthrobacter sp. NPDC090520 TaxID=3364382 RepID=UPI003829483D
MDAKDLPGAVSAYYAANGNPYDLFQLTGNPGLPIDVMFHIAAHRDWAEASGLLTNYSVPTEVLEFLADRFPDADGDINHHPNASLARKMRLIAREATGSSLHSFFAATKADDAEQAKFHALLDESTAGATIAEIWHKIRPEGSAPRV